MLDSSFTNNFTFFTLNTNLCIAFMRIKCYNIHSVSPFCSRAAEIFPDAGIIPNNRGYACIKSSRAKGCLQPVAEESNNLKYSN